MHIIIVGCGKVGSTLAEQLQEEDTDLTLIDTDADVINNLTEDIDAMGIVGNGASINTLMEAGVKTADIMIAVTASDELNLLCCLIAQKTGHCQTIARVRNPIYSKMRLVYSGTPWSFHDHQSGTGHCQRNLKTSAFSGSHQNRSIFKRTCRTSQV